MDGRDTRAVRARSSGRKVWVTVALAALALGLGAGAWRLYRHRWYYMTVFMANFAAMRDRTILIDFTADPLRSAESEWGERHDPKGH
jgi:hypothetical protein